ncbi:MAG: DUF6491 family protein [Pseudomonadales bacterium]
MKRSICGCLVGISLGLVGCAASGPAAEERQAQAQARQEALQDILSTPLSAADYTGDQERCLSSYAYRSVDVLDDQHVVFKGSGERLWLNKLRTRCIGLRPDEILQFEMRNNRVCDLDNFQAMDSFMYTARTSGTCTLGKFMPVSPEQMEAIELAFKESRDSGS